MLDPIASHLSQGPGRSVRPDNSRDVPRFRAGMAAHRYDVVHLHRCHQARAHADHGYEAILQNEQLEQKRRDGGIDSVEDLRGRRVLLFGGGRGAMMSHKVPRSLLQGAGVGAPECGAAFAANAVIARTLGERC